MKIAERNFRTLFMYVLHTYNERIKTKEEPRKLQGSPDHPSVNQFKISCSVEDELYKNVNK